jgi:glucan biosynthesis protein C
VVETRETNSNSRLAATPPGKSSKGNRDVSLDYLKAAIVLLVVAHHSCLAYCTFAHFDPTNYLNSTAPVVDTARWAPFDYAENFNDVFFMSLMFLISGLFVWPSLRRSGAMAFIRGRLVRLGIPFVVGVALLMPLAGYASWQLTDHPTGYLAYWRMDIARERFPGPLWFVWVLLSYGILAAGFYGVWPRRATGLPVTWTRVRPAVAFVIMFWLCAFAYLPALKAFNWAWGAIGAPPFYVQFSRIGPYLLWFGVGVWLGSDDLERGLLAREGLLARRWIGYVVVGVVAYNALWFVPRWLAETHAVTPEKRDAIWAILWVASCVASCFGFLALFRGTVY